MSRQSRSGEEPGLFDDLPLQSKPQPSPALPAKPEPLPLFGEPESSAKPASVKIETPTPAPSATAPISGRLSAAVIDLGVVVAVLALIRIGLWWLGVAVDSGVLVPLLVFMLPFSFLYLVFPLAFWGRTPGMIKAGLVARSDDDRSLSFSQAALRWVAGIVSVLTLGLPLLLVKFTGRSLADQISRSRLVSAR
jgi:uncharacterized RDD family membrane protein YckC